MPCLRTPSTSSNPNAFEPTQRDLLEVQRRVLPRRSGRARPPSRACRAPSARGRRPRSVSCLPTVSYTTSMPPGNAIGSPSCARSTPPDHAAASSITASAGVVRDHRRAELARPARPARSKRATTPHLDVGVERAQDRDRARAERAGAVDHHLAARRRRVPRDRVQRHRERVGEHRELVGDVVGHLEQHRVVRGHELRRSRR